MHGFTAILIVSLVIPATDLGAQETSSLDVGDVVRIIAPDCGVDEQVARYLRLYQDTLTVQADTAAQVDFQFDVGEATLVVDIRGEGGAAIDFGLVSLFQGQVAYTTARDLFAADTVFQGTVRSSMWLPGRPVRFTQLVPEAYTVCVVPVAGELTDFRRMRRLREQADKIQAHCFPRQVADTTEEQVFSPEVPPMAPLPGEFSPPEEEITTPQATKERPVREPDRVKPP